MVKSPNGNVVGAEVKVNNVAVGMTNAEGKVETAEVYLIGQKIEVSATKAPLNPFGPMEMIVSSEDIIVNMITFGMYFFRRNLLNTSHQKSYYRVRKD